MWLQRAKACYWQADWQTSYFDIYIIPILSGFLAQPPPQGASI